MMSVDVDRLRTHIATLCISPRPAESPALERARQYVENELAYSGWQIERQPFDAESMYGEKLRGINLVARHHDHFDTALPQLCIGAHLDSRPDSPGADDNASAVAALLEIARLLPPVWPKSPRMGIELVAFDLEENNMLGGEAHARQYAAAGIDLRGMVSLEMLGYCDPRPGAQSLPRGLKGKYPETGDFIAIIGNQVSQPLIDRWRAGMQRSPELKVEWLSVPQNGEYLQATRLSDHSPFWDMGYAALMITDTSFMRNPHYHLASDTLETLDLEFLGRVTLGCFHAVCDVLELGLPKTEATRE